MENQRELGDVLVLLHLPGQVHLGLEIEPRGGLGRGDVKVPDLGPRHLGHGVREGRVEVERRERQAGVEAGAVRGNEEDGRHARAEAV